MSTVKRSARPRSQLVRALVRLTAALLGLLFISVMVVFIYPWLVAYGIIR